MPCILFGRVAASLDHVPQPESTDRYLVGGWGGGGKVVYCVVKEFIVFVASYFAGLCGHIIR